MTDAAVRLDWTQFSERVAALAVQLTQLGAGPEAPVALWLPNSADYLAAIFACARVGALAVHVNTRFRATEVGSLVRRSGARLLLTEWGFGPVDFPAIFASVPAGDRGELSAIIGRRLPSAITTLAGVPTVPLASGVGGDAADAATPASRCLTFTTSGTTSGPKLVLHLQGDIACHAREVMAKVGFDRPGGALLAAAPLCGTFGNVAAMAAVAGGAHIICMDRFDGPEAVRLMRRHRISHSVGGDDMLARIVEAAAGEPFPDMRMFGFASFTSRAQATAAAALELGLAPKSVYGSSEVQALFAIAEDDTRLRTGGFPVSTAAQASVRDPHTGAILPDGQSGELCFKGPSRFAGYLGDDAATARSTTADGFFRSGDLGRLDGAGFVFEARIGDTLRLGGFLVSPEEIEGFITSLPGVAGAQVVGVEDASGAMTPVGFVIAEAGAVLEEATLIAHCREGLARFKAPRRIAVVDAFPVTESANGAKIQRVKLRDMAQRLMSETN